MSAASSGVSEKPPGRGRRSCISWTRPRERPSPTVPPCRLMPWPLRPWPWARPWHGCPRRMGTVSAKIRGPAQLGVPLDRQASGGREATLVTRLRGREAEQAHKYLPDAPGVRSTNEDEPVPSRASGVRGCAVLGRPPERPWPAPGLQAGLRILEPKKGAAVGHVD